MPKHILCPLHDIIGQTFSVAECEQYLLHAETWNICDTCRYHLKMIIERARAEAIAEYEKRKEK